MTHNCVIYSHETAWLKKNDSQATICKLLLPNLTGLHLALCRGSILQSATVGYVFTPTPDKLLKRTCLFMQRG